MQPTDDHLDNILQQMWEMDKVPSPTHHSEDDQKAVEHFRDTHKVMDDGRYSVQLPRISPRPELGESRSSAIRRYISNEQVLKRKGKLEEFKAVMREYFTLGHAERVPTNELNLPPTDCFYLPIHGVMKESSTSTKLRAVFDASAKSQSGISLNDQLLAGPNLYPLLTTILNRFRTFNVAITADISKMFRGVELQKVDRGIDG